METWLTYSPRDFLLFSEETYWRLFALANDAFWPLPLVAPLLIVLLAALIAAWPHGRFLGLLLLGAAWVLVAEGFFARFYAPINFVADYARAAFVLEAVLLVSLGFRLRFASGGLRRTIGAAFVLVAAAYPLLAVAARRPLAAAEVVAIAPDPTAVATLGILLLARPSWQAGVLSVIPVIWLLAGAATLLTMGVATGWLPLVAAVGAVLVMAWSAVRAGRARPSPVHPPATPQGTPR